MTNEVIDTKWGSAKIINGYYTITTHKKGNHGKLLHRLIFEDFYKINLPTNIDIHHHDGNKLNNNIWNLIPLTRSEHISIHQTGESNSHYEQEMSTNTKLKIGKSQNKTGFFRVHIHKEPTCKQGFYYEYRYLKNKKYHSICSVDIDKLKEKVLKKGLEWVEYDKLNEVVVS